MRRGVPSLSALQAFEAAARHESFSKAALELSQTHGAVCKKVNELEAHLGIPLFERVRQRLVLSAAGAEYARRIRVHLDQIRRDTLELMRQQSEVKIQLAVGVTFASQWLIPRLHDFYALNPDLQLHIMGRDQPTFFDNSSFDAAIYFGQSLWPAMPGQPLVSDDEILAVCAPALIGARDGLSSEEDQHAAVDSHPRSSARVACMVRKRVRAGHRTQRGEPALRHVHHGNQRGDFRARRGVASAHPDRTGAAQRRTRPGASSFDPESGDRLLLVSRAKT